MDNFYQRIAEVYKKVQIEPKLLDSKNRLVSKKLIMIPVDKPYHQLGATILLAYLAFPDETEAKQRSKFVSSINAKLIKLKYPQNSPKRKNLHKFTVIRNEAIKMFLGVNKKSAGYRLNMRMRASHTMWRKLLSNNGLGKQESLHKIATETAKVNTESFPAFYSEKGNDPADSFSKRIIVSTKPVMHLAMGSYLQDYKLGMVDNSIVGKVMNADQWLVETLFLTEMIRAEFKCFFPNKNTANELNKTIAFFPIKSTDFPKNNNFEQYIINQLR